MCVLGRVVILGGGMSGLLCARALSGHAREILVYERDKNFAGSMPRRGVPQGHHVHCMLAA